MRAWPFYNSSSLNYSADYFACKSISKQRATFTALKINVMRDLDAMISKLLPTTNNCILHTTKHPYIPVSVNCMSVNQRQCSVVILYCIK